MLSPYDLTTEAVDYLFDDLLQCLAKDAKEISTDDKRYLLESIVTTLDVMDEDDTFGTEGWRHRYDIRTV